MEPGKKACSLSDRKPVRIRDRKALARLAFILAGLLIAGWMLWRGYSAQPPEPPSGIPFIILAATILTLLIGDRAWPRPAAGRKGRQGFLFQAGRPRPRIRSWPGALGALRPGVGVSRELKAGAPAGIEPRSVDRSWLRSSLLRLRIPGAFLLALLAQHRIEFGQGSGASNTLLFLIAGALMGWWIWSGEGCLETPERGRAAGADKSVAVRWRFLAAAGALAVLAFVAAGGNRFRLSTITFWVGSMICTLIAFWEGEISLGKLAGGVLEKTGRMRDGFRVDSWTMLLLVAFFLVACFRFFRLSEVPYDLWSDQAEKLLDVSDVLKGNYSIFFPRNGGREAAAFYAVAAISKLLGSGPTFLSLKIVSALAGVFALPFLYLLARQMGGRLLGLLAMILAGIGYWPNVISRVGLRLPFHPMFLAPAMFFLVRGLDSGRRNDLLLSGLAAGLGLYGYASARITPFLLAAGTAVYLAHHWRRRFAWRPVVWLLMTSAVILAVSTPLLRVTVDQPEDVLRRTITRIGQSEVPYAGPPGEIFLSNLWNGLRMFNVNNGVTSSLSIPLRPALDWITGGLFVLGVAILIVRYLRRRNWVDLFILISLPILLLPSVLALAFPIENPHPSRAGGAIIPVFILAALPLAILLGKAASGVGRSWARLLRMALAMALLILAVVNNFRLVYVDYDEQIRQIMWNTREVGSVVRGFAESVGDYDSVRVIPYPYWLDTRLVGMAIGQPEMDFALPADQLEGYFADRQGPKLLIFKPEDEETLQRLQALFPEGMLRRWDSAHEEKDFMLYFVPGGGGAWAASSR